MPFFGRPRIKTLALLVRVDDRAGRRVFYSTKLPQCRRQLGLVYGSAPIIGDPGPIATVACAATSSASWLGDLLHVVAQVARPNIWSPQIVDLRFDGAWHGPFADIGNLQEPSSWLTCAATGDELDVFSYGYESRIWHGTNGGNQQWQTETIEAPPHEEEIIGEVECAVDVSSWTSFRAFAAASSRCSRCRCSPFGVSRSWAW